MKLESLLQYLSEYLRLEEFPDYPLAFNGLQVEGPDTVSRICAAVDASEAVIEEATRRGADLLIVHHGLFWAGRHRVTGPRYRKLRKLLTEGLALFSAHLPLDAHPEVGNCAILARELYLVEVRASPQGTLEMEGVRGHVDDADLRRVCRHFGARHCQRLAVE